MGWNSTLKLNHHNHLLITCDLLGTHVVGAAHILAHLFKISRIHTGLFNLCLKKMFSCNLRITVEPYLYQIFKIHSSWTQIDSFSFQSSSQFCPALLLIKLNKKLLLQLCLLSPTDVFFPAASRHCSPVLTRFIFAVLTHPPELPCFLCHCSSGCFHLRTPLGIFCLFVSRKEHCVPINGYWLAAF